MVLLLMGSCPMKLRSVVPLALCALLTFSPFALAQFPIPAIGLGIGNAEHEKIPELIRHAVDVGGIRLLDTAMASRNHHLIRQTNFETPPIVETKIWYTHLGYGRTKLAIAEAMKELGVDVLDVVLIHWPACNDETEWMSCEEEEKALPDHIKAAGPPPSAAADKTVPWKESWKALEEAYKEGQIKAIGVSNFYLDEMQALVINGTVKPHVMQGDFWDYLFDPHLGLYLQYHEIPFQAYGVFSSLLPRFSTARGRYRKRADTAYNTICLIGSQMNPPLSCEQTIMFVLLNKGVSIIPRASSIAQVDSVAAMAGWEKFDLGDSGYTVNDLAKLIEQLLKANHEAPEEEDELFHDEL